MKINPVASIQQNPFLKKFEKRVTEENKEKFMEEVKSNIIFRPEESLDAHQKVQKILTFKFDC